MSNEQMNQCLSLDFPFCKDKLNFLLSLSVRLSVMTNLKFWSLANMLTCFCLLVKTLHLTCSKDYTRRTIFNKQENIRGALINVN